MKNMGVGDDPAVLLMAGFMIVYTVAAAGMMTVAAKWRDRAYDAADRERRTRFQDAGLRRMVEEMRRGTPGAAASPPPPPSPLPTLPDTRIDSGAAGGTPPPWYIAPNF